MKRRRLERRWRKTRLTVDRKIYTQQCAVVHRLIRKSKASYYTDIISELKSKPSDLFGTLETLLKGKTEKLYLPCNSSEDLANLFADYFERKISTIRADLDLRRPILQDPFPDACFEHSKVLFWQFTLVSGMQLEKLVTKFSRKSCDLDPIPATVLKECLHDLIPVITKLVNISITDAVVPSSLKNASLSPRLKKTNLNHEEFSSFRPISNLSFISKCVEKVVATQLYHHVEDNNLNEVYQSAYKQYHSTETALIKVQEIYFEPLTIILA